MREAGDRTERRLAPTGMRSGFEPGNALLRFLSPEDLAVVRPHLEEVGLDVGQRLYEMGDRVNWVVFPEAGLLSLVTSMASGAEVETSMVGREGGVGFVEALGGGVMHSRLVVQVPGRAYRMAPKHYREAFVLSAGLRRAVHRQVELLLAEARQEVACHTLHPVQERFCRWLLECQDLSGGPEILPLKQEFLALMLGVQRTTVTEVAKEAQALGHIRYSRGRIEILDREGLEHNACECRATLQELRRQLEPSVDDLSDPPLGLEGACDS